MNKYNLIFWIAVSIFFLSPLNPKIINAQTPTPSPSVVISNINGYAWSPNIGWLSLNCQNTNSCANSNYKVVLNETSGYLTGYAWSPNIGWVKFGGLSSFPTTVPAAQNAKIDMTTGTVSGWVRACAGTASGRCVNMTSRTDGWDGWIKLTGTNHPSASGNNQGLFMTLASGAIRGFSWGNPVVGWLRFDAQKGVVTPLDATCSAADIGGGNMQFEANASGGIGDYEYSWDNGSWVTTDIYTKAISGTGLQNATLKVREVGKTDEIAKTCSGYPSSTAISGSCTINGAQDNVNILVGESVDLAATVSPGNAGDYDYTWYTGQGSYVGTETLTEQYNSPIEAYTVRVMVKDKKNLLQPKTLSCGQVSVKNRELNLFIGRNAETASNKELIIKKGRNVGLMWVNTLDTRVTSPDRYRCSGSITPNVSSANWNIFLSSNVDVNGSMENLNTPQTGKFTFSIICQPEGIGSKIESSILLNVVSTSGTEI